MQAGDTLWDVAERCLGDGALVDEIVACNPHLSAARRLRPGTVLELPAHARIPQTSSEAGTPAVDAAVHVVVEGDTLWDIVADHYGAADRALVASVAAHNQIGDPSLIHPYDRIELPTDLARQVADESVGGNARVVVTGDTLWDIVADHYGVADRDMVWAVADANQLENPSLIFPGQRLMLPDDPVREAPDPAPATPSVDDPAPATSQADAPQLEEPAVPDTVATESAVAGPPPSVDTPTIPASPDAAAPWDSPNATTAPSEVPIGPVADTAQIAASSSDDGASRISRVECAGDRLGHVGGAGPLGVGERAVVVRRRCGDRARSGRCMGDAAAPPQTEAPLAGPRRTSRGNRDGVARPRDHRAAVDRRDQATRRRRRPPDPSGDRGRDRHRARRGAVRRAATRASAWLDRDRARLAPITER